MLKILETENDAIISTIASDKLTKEDYKRLVPDLEKKINKHGKINWYFEMDNFKGFEVGAMWEDLKVDVKHFNSFNKIAMVGDKTWEKILTDIMKPFTTAEVHFYDLKDQEKAHKWIQEA